MYDATRDQAQMPEHAKDPESGYGQVEVAIVEAGGNPNDPLELEVATVAAWCAAHGVAEMVGLKQFEPLRQALGGEEELARALLQHVTAYNHGHGHRRRTDA
jgi:hypothetical protein